MREKIHTYGYNFDFDKELTRNYYDNYDGLCSCATCQNFYANMHSFPLELRDFLEQFGIDISKPIEQWSTAADTELNIVNNIVYYAVNGTAKSNDGYEIDIGTVQIVVMPPNPDDVIHCPENSPNAEFLEPYFVFEIHNLWLPWIVEDDINTCYPERKTFRQRLKSLLKRFYIK